MGKHKFKLSDMIPNAWFYKLKEMGNKGGSKQMKKPKPCNLQSNNLSPSSTPRKSHKQNQSFTPNRASYYITTRLDLDLDLDLETKKLSSPRSPRVLLVDPPRKSKKRNKRRPSKPICSTSPSNCTTCRIRKPEPESETESNPDFVRPCCTCRVTTSPTDIIIDVADSGRVVSKKLPPIITKQENNDEILKTLEKKSSPKEAFKLKTRAKSPRIATKHRKSNARKSNARKSVSDNGVLDGFAIVKSSSDPQKDFMESMVEMIMENKIRKTKDLEDLLACYLSLNSAEYHDVIVKVFEQIWFDFTKIRLQ